MKLTCSQGDLANALSIVNRAVSPNNTLPVLNNILLTAEGGKLILNATNLEIAISAKIDSKVEKTGSITVPSRVFSSYVPLLKDENVELVLTGETLELKTKGTNTKMKGINSEEFPSLPRIEDAKIFRFPAKKIKYAIEQVVFAASTNISRPVLTGVLWKIDGNKMKMVATDSYRLAEKTIDLDEDTGETVAIIVPSKTAFELSKILSGDDSSVLEVSITKNQIMFKVGDVELVSRLIDGNFPDYEKILPEKAKISTVLNVDDFILALKKVLVIVKENNNSVRARLSGGKIMITSDETQVGEGSSELECSCDGDDTEVALNAQYLVDVLGHLNDSNVKLGLNDGFSPVMVEPASADDYMHIIMPLKI